jgi:acetolactate synthase-1/2/3 large subunit
MTTTADIHVDRGPGQSETRIASYLLVEYLERLGVESSSGCAGTPSSRSSMRWAEPDPVRQRAMSRWPPAADGYARAAQAVGVLSPTGPGLTNAATGVANAALDSIPMVVIAGDVPSHYYGRHPHQK